MRVNELSREQINQLKQQYLISTLDYPSWLDLSNCDDLPDAIIERYYEGVEFVEDDFFR